MAVPKVLATPPMWVTTDSKKWLKSILTELRRVEKEGSRR